MQDLEKPEQTDASGESAHQKKEGPLNRKRPNKGSGGAHPKKQPPPSKEYQEEQVEASPEGANERVVYSQRVLEAAERYVGAGLKVVLCHHKGKKLKTPLAGFWRKPNLGTDDLEKVARGIQNSPLALLAVAITGDLLVIDLDGPEAEAYLAEKGYGLPANTLEVTTPKGRHIWCRAPSGVELKSSTRPFGEGVPIDLLAERYVIAPPSAYRLKDDQGKPLSYQPINGSEMAFESLSPAPPWAVTLCTGRGQEEAPSQGAEEVREGHRNEDLHRLLLRKIAAGLRGDDLELVARGFCAKCLPPLSWEEEGQKVLASALKSDVAEKHLGGGDTEYAGLELGTPLFNSWDEDVLSLNPDHDWLDSRIPIGKLTMVSGAGGHGKGHVVKEVAVRLSRGLSPFPVKDGDPRYECRNQKVLVLSGEDARKDLLWRIRAGDKDAVDPSNFLFDKLPGHRLDKLVPAIHKAVAERGVTSVIIDPLISFIGSEKEFALNSGQDMRTILSGIEKLAEEQRLSVLIVAHMRKAPAKGYLDPQDMVAGSKQLWDMFRSILYVKSSKEVGYLAGEIVQAKENYNFTSSNSINFCVTPVKIDGRETPAPLFEWGSHGNTTIYELFSGKDEDGPERPPSKTVQARKILLACLQDQPILHWAGHLKGGVAASIDCTHRTVQRAYAELVEEGKAAPAVRRGQHGTIWRLRGVPEDAEIHEAGVLSGIFEVKD